MASNYEIEFLSEVEKELSRIADEVADEWLADTPTARRIDEVARKIAVEIERRRAA